MKRIKSTTEKILEELNLEEHKFRRRSKNELSPLTFEEYNEQRNIDKYEIRFDKEVYNEYLNETIEIYLISKNKKEIIDYIARKFSKDRFGCKYYGDFYKVKRKDIETTVWEFGGDKFYEE